MQHQRDNMSNDRELRTFLFNHMDLYLQVPNLSYYISSTIKFVLIHQAILQFMINRCIQRLQCSIPIKRFKFLNTKDCSIDNVIQLIQCRERNFHFRIRSYYTSHRGNRAATRSQSRSTLQIQIQYPHDHMTNYQVVPSALFGIPYFHRGMSFQ